MKITIGHTPDMDDAFMFFGMLEHKIDTEGIEFEDTLKPIASLNRDAHGGLFDMTAVSVAHIPSVIAHYDILTSGTCMAEKRGPVLVLRTDRIPQKIAVPGHTTTAAFCVRLYDPAYELHAVRFNAILPHVLEGTCDGGVIISEDQLRIDTGLTQVDLGAWWYNKTHHPLPLGVDLVRKDLDIDIKKTICRVFQRSIKYATTHPDQAIEYAKKYQRHLSSRMVETFVRTFVNDLTINLGKRGKEAIEFFLHACWQRGIIDAYPDLVFTDGEDT